MKNKEVKERLKEAYKQFSAPEIDSALISKCERARLNQELFVAK